MGPLARRYALPHGVGFVVVLLVLVSIVFFELEETPSIPDVSDLIRSAPILPARPSYNQPTINRPTQPISYRTPQPARQSANQPELLYIAIVHYLSIVILCVHCVLLYHHRCAMVCPCKHTHTCTHTRVHMIIIWLCVWFVCLCVCVCLLFVIADISCDAFVVRGCSYVD